MTKLGHITASMTGFSFVCMCVLFFLFVWFSFWFCFGGGTASAEGGCEGTERKWDWNA